MEYVLWGRPKGKKDALYDVEPVKYNPTAVQKAINKDKRIGGKEAKAIHSLLKGRTGDGAETKKQELERKLKAARHEMNLAKHDGSSLDFQRHTADIVKRLEREVASAKDVAPVGDGESDHKKWKMEQVKQECKQCGGTGKKDGAKCGNCYGKGSYTITRTTPANDDEDDAFKRDTDKGSAILIKKDAKTMTSAEIARKYGFSLSFVKEVLGGDNTRPGHPGDVAPVGDLSMDKLTKLRAHEASARKIGNIKEADAFAAKIKEVEKTVEQEDPYEAADSILRSAGFKIGGGGRGHYVKQVKGTSGPGTGHYWIVSLDHNGWSLSKNDNGGYTSGNLKQLDRLKSNLSGK